VTFLSTMTSVHERAPRSAHDGYDHLTPLLHEFAATSPTDRRRRALRDELATGFLPVVRNIARRYRNRGEPTDDLEQVGAVGLLGALERFDPAHGADFLSFAVPTITGEIRRHFRDRTWAMRVPRRLKDLQGPMGDAVGVLSAALGRAPRPSEIAAHLDVTVDEVVDALAAQQAYSADSLDALVNAGDTALVDSLGQADAALATAEYRHELRRALDELPERERAIVALRFFGDLTQSQIAERVGLSQMHVSRLLGQTLATLRARIDAA
jgi:RNA polymerase sigma-B factor